MKNQQTEIIWLREVAAREKEAATRVQTRLLKSIETQWKSQSTPTAGRNERAPPSLTYTRDSAYSTGSSRRNRSETYEDNEDVVAATFISWLQVTNPFYKHLVKNDVTKMGDILVQAQKYIQIEEAIWAASSCPPRQGPEVEKPRP